jgi:hypothetical protein
LTPKQKFIYHSLTTLVSKPFSAKAGTVSEMLCSISRTLGTAGFINRLATAALASGNHDCILGLLSTERILSVVGLNVTSSDFSGIEEIFRI